MTSLTPEQRELIERAGRALLRVEDPETREVYVVVKEEIYRRLKNLEEIEQSDLSLFEFEDLE